MNVNQRRLLFAISEAQPCDFATLSVSTRMATDFLSVALDDLQDRGFVNLRDGRYRLTAGVLDHLHQTTGRTALSP